MEVIQHDDIVVRRFENPFKRSNSFLLETNVGSLVWLFDIGNSPSIIRELSNRSLNGLFITHAHFDHIIGIKELLARHPECIVYGSEKCIRWLGDDRRNLSFYYESPLCLQPFNYYCLTNGDILQLSRDIVLRAIATPGHTEDSMSYLIGSILVSGDSFIPNVPPVTKLKGGNREDYAKSLCLLQTHIHNGTLLLPGHGPVYNGSDFNRNSNKCDCSPKVTC